MQSVLWDVISCILSRIKGMEKWVWRSCFHGAHGARNFHFCNSWLYMYAARRVCSVVNIHAHTREYGIIFRSAARTPAACGVCISTGSNIDIPIIHVWIAVIAYFAIIALFSSVSRITWVVYLSRILRH